MSSLEVEPTDKLALPHALELVVERLTTPMMMAEIARELGVTPSRLTRWCAADPQRSARVREARRMAAALWEEKAQKAIEDAKDDLELKKAKELAHHLRWKASKIDPGQFGDKIEVGAPGDFSKVEDSDLAQRLEAMVPGLGAHARRLLTEGAPPHVH
jgi:transposase-like protein